MYILFDISGVTLFESFSLSSLWASAMCMHTIALGSSRFCLIARQQSKLAHARALAHTHTFLLKHGPVQDHCPGGFRRSKESAW